MKKIILILSVTLMFLVIGYLLGKKQNQRQETIDFSENADVGIPQCSFGLCPEYQSMDVDGDGLSESVVIVPTAMTQGAGQVWVIDQGKVVWKSQEFMRIAVAALKDQNKPGFALLYTKEPNSTEGSAIEYAYKDGNFIGQP